MGAALSWKKINDLPGHEWFGLDRYHGWIQDIRNLNGMFRAALPLRGTYRYSIMDFASKERAKETVEQHYISTFIAQ